MTMNDRLESDRRILTEIVEPSLVPDQPILALDQDYLDRGEFASELARQLKGYRDDNCLVVAFYAPWGAGKSSLLNLLANELTRDTESLDTSPVVIRFNPWNFSNLDSLLSMFFRELQAAIGRSDPKLAKKVQTSLQLLSVLLAVGELSTVAGTLFARLSRLIRRSAKILDEKAESLIAVKERTNEELRKLERRIFVLIDDIDRLDQESMRFMFRLIRLNADFDRITYVLAFDRDIVSKVLTQEQEISGGEYLEKIVQVGFDIPPAEMPKLQRLFARSVDRLGLLTDSGEENLIRWVDLKAGGIDKLIRTPRDVVRYVNGLAVNSSIVADEVNPVDLAGIEVIRTFAPKLYSFIRDNRSIMIGQAGGSWHNDNQATREQHRSRLDEAYLLCKSELQPAIKEICSQLFPETMTLYDGSTFGSGYYDAWRKSRRICTTDYFTRYFYLRPSDNEVSQAEFEMILGDAGDHKKLESRLRELIDTDKMNNFVGRLYDSADELPDEHIEPTVLALFDVGDNLKAGLWPENQMLEVASVVHRLLVRLPKPARRRVLSAVADGAASLGAVVYFASLYSEHSEENRRLMERKEWNEIRDKLVIRVSAAGEDLTLARSPHLGILLYRWKEWAPTEDCARFVRRLTESDDGVLAFLQGMIAQQSSSVGRYASRRGWHLPIDNVKEFIDPKIFEKSIQRIKRERWDDLTDLQREAIDAFFVAREPRRGMPS